MGFSLEKFKKKLEADGSSYLSEEISKKFGSLTDAKLVCKEINGKRMYSLPFIESMEKSIAKNIVRQLSYQRKNLAEDIINRLIDDFETESESIMGFHCELHEEQRNAVIMAVNCNMGIITGGPGTGKTTVVNAVVYVENHRPDRAKKPFIRFTAPTGKAARRITESTGFNASTVQREIGANDYEDIPKSINCDIFIVDEGSMIDTVVMYQLMRALDTGVKTLILGDVDQLPSVGIGSVLRDLIDSKVIPVVKLEKTFRQKGDSYLATNIMYLQKGYGKLDQGVDFSIIEDFDDDSIVESLISTVIEEREIYGGDGVVLLTPYRRKGKTCANRMNALLQERLNPTSVKVEADILDTDEETGEDYILHVILKVGDPVMQLFNLESDPIANGDVGVVTNIYTDEAIRVDFGHCDKIYETKELSQLSLAYAMSVHKSQGSEYPCVITCALPEHKQLLNRNMVYTAVTRAKKECVFFVKEEVLQSALKIEGGYIRTTCLCEEIQYEDKRRKLVMSTVA